MRSNTSSQKPRNNALDVFMVAICSRIFILLLGKHIDTFNFFYCIFFYVVLTFLSHNISAGYISDAIVPDYDTSSRFDLTGTSKSCVMSDGDDPEPQVTPNIYNMFDCIVFMLL